MKIMRWPFMMVGKLRYPVAAAALLSAAVTLAFIWFLWSVFAPSSFTAVAVFILLAAICAPIMGFALFLLLTALVFYFMMWLVGRRMRRAFDALAKQAQEKSKKKLK
ncbi:MAG: hypothetical protein QXO69_02215 [archaeon]